MAWSIAEIRDLLVVVQLAATTGLSALVWWMRSTFVPRREFEARLSKADQVRDAQFGELRDRLDRMHERLVNGDGRFALLEHRLADMPTTQNLAEMQITVERLAGDVRVAVKQLEGMGRQVALMDEYLRQPKQ